MAAKKKNSVEKKKAPTKAEVLRNLAEETGLTRKDVTAVFDALTSQIQKNLAGRNGPKVFTLPGLVKMSVRERPATAARMGRNPFTGEEIRIAAKKASKTVKVTALKGLKDMVRSRG